MHAGAIVMKVLTHMFLIVLIVNAPLTNQNFKQPHAGSTILAVDIDNDNDKDLILGDIFIIT